MAYKPTNITGGPHPASFFAIPISITGAPGASHVVRQRLLGHQQPGAPTALALHRLGTLAMDGGWGVAKTWEKFRGNAKP